MPRLGISYVPIVLGVVGLLAGLALVSDHNVRTWAVVMSCTTIAAVGYGAYQEQRAHRAIRIARLRVGSVPYDEVRREMDRARRHERPFALARVQFSVNAGGKAPSARWMMEQLSVASSRRLWRSTDRFWRNGRSLYLILPETTARSAEAMVTRAVRERSDLLELGTIVAFPEDGVTIGSLFARLGAQPPAADDLGPIDVRGATELADGLEALPVRLADDGTNGPWAQ